MKSRAWSQPWVLEGDYIIQQSNIWATLLKMSHTMSARALNSWEAEEETFLIPEKKPEDKTLHSNPMFIILFKIKGKRGGIRLWYLFRALKIPAWINIQSPEQHLQPTHPCLRRISTNSEHYCPFPNNVTVCSLFKSNALLFAAWFMAGCSTESSGQGTQSHTAQGMGGTKAFFSDYLNMCYSNIKSPWTLHQIT